jgi:transcriptional regulator with XRE-family HTH domain
MRQPTIHRIITGESEEPRRSNLMRLARYFGVELQDLFGKDVKLKAAPKIDTQLMRIFDKLAAVPPEHRDLIFRQMNTLLDSLATLKRDQ